MAYELIGEFPAVDDREQVGHLLRFAFPLALESFPELLDMLKRQEASEGALAID